MRTITAACGAAFVGMVLLSGAASADDSPTGGGEDIGPGALPVGHADRYTIPHYYSVISGGGRSFTAVTIRNNSATSCEAAVRFQQGFGTFDLCVVNQTISAGQGRTYCSRPPGSFGAYDCNAACSPELAFHAGHAFVSSSNSTACANIAVDAEVVYTSNATDDVVTGLTRLTVSRFGRATSGD